MSVEAFVRAAGGVMGQARDGFGTGVGVLLPLPSAPVPPSPLTPGEGQAADGQQGAATEQHHAAAALGALDDTGRSELDAAAASAAGGRVNMEAIIAQAVADVEALGLTTGTPEGQRALIEAVKLRLEETRGTVQTGAADAGTHAASTSANAAGYGGVASQPRGGGLASMLSGMPMGGMPMGGGGMPMGGGGMPGFGGMSNLLTGLTTPLSTASRADSAGGGHGRARGPVSEAARIALKDVRYDRTAFPMGKEAYRRYISEALDIMGVEDPKARARWMTGYLTAAARESSYNPLAVNTDDVNARRLAGRAPDGFPAGSSRGGLQTIPETFAQYHHPGTSTNIYDPVANICASMNYVMGRYGVDRGGANLFKVAQFNPNSAGGGY